jgi:hypothetical protein
VDLYAGHVAFIVVSLVLLLPVFLTHVVLALTFIDRIPDPTGKKNLLSAVHGA